MFEQIHFNQPLPFYHGSSSDHKSSALHWLLEIAYCVTSNNTPSHPYDPENIKIMHNYEQ